MCKHRNTGKSILIVDDEPQVLMALKRELEILPLNEPLNIMLSETTSFAMECLKEHSNEIFLVIADLRMPSPNISGSDLLLKIHELYPDIVLIMLTAYTDIPEIQKAINADIQALLFKPWDPKILLLEIMKAKNLFKIRKEKKDLEKRIAEQLKFAGEFQRKILSVPSFSSSYIDINLKYKPLPDYHCGGDYYDLIKVGKEKFILLLGDVSGHGIKPAMITAMLKVITSNIIAENPDISVSKLATLINRKICQQLGKIADLIVTFSAILIDPVQKEIRVTNAGHFPLYLLRDNQCRILKFSGPAMGFKNSICYKEDKLSIKSGDRFILFTDGLIELHNEKRFMEEKDIAAEFSRHYSSEKLVESLYSSFKKYHNGETYNDDITIAVIDIF